jgi:hypothetical protein
MFVRPSAALFMPLQLRSLCTKPAIERQGSSCPTGYYKSGEYCVQGSDRASPAIERAGKSCPSGYYRSGDYYMTGSERAKPAITRQGSSCPTGHYKSSEYCVQNR